MTLCHVVTSAAQSKTRVKDKDAPGMDYCQQEKQLHLYGKPHMLGWLRNVKPHLIF